ncbi:MAG: cyclic nucleotide-binding domain-containing protein [Lentisphaeria bacterium]|nr:cyclic nucleotide-binding domain-containing protein [Lentisphaeria bacterium]
MANAINRFPTQGLKRKSFQQDETIIKEGSQGGRAYILEYGEVVIRSHDNVIGRITEPGTIFGEISALLDCPHSACCVADFECGVFVIDDFNEYCLEQDKEVLLEISKLTAQRLVNISCQVSELSERLKDLEERAVDPATLTKFSQIMLQFSDIMTTDITGGDKKKKLSQDYEE